MGISQKTPFATSVNSFVTRKLKDHQQGLGQVLPCHVVAVKDNMVTVNFDVLAGQLTLPPVTCPIAESKYVRLPVQVGDQGLCMAANARLGEISGLGLGKAPLVQPSNLGSLVFVPISKTTWEKVDVNALNLSGPNGVVLRDSGNKCTLTLTPAGVVVKVGNITFTIGTNGVTVNGGKLVINTDIELNGSMVATGAVTSAGIGLATHRHSGVRTGTDNTGTPI